MRTLGLVYASPYAAFQALIVRPRAALVLFAYAILNAGFATLWLSKVDLAEMAREQLEGTPVWSQLSADDQLRVMEGQRRARPLVAATALAGPVLIVVVVAAVYCYMFKILVGQGATFERFLAGTAISFLAVDAVRLSLIALTMTLTGNWNAHPSRVLQASLAMFLDPSQRMSAFYVFLESWDLFTFWLVYLLTAAFAVVSGRTVRQTLPITLGGWLTFVVIKVAIAAIV